METASEVKSHSSIDRFLDVFHSPTGMAETGLLACRSVTHAKADPRNGIPRPTVESIFEVVIDGKVHRVEGKSLQRWILKQQ